MISRIVELFPPTIIYIARNILYLLLLDVHRRKVSMESTIASISSSIKVLKCFTHQINGSITAMLKLFF